MIDELAIQRERQKVGRASPAAPPLSSTAPLLVWLLIQVGALSVAAFRLPLAAKYPQPAEMQGANVLLAAQIIGLSLLFPFLCRTWNCTIAIAGSAVPLLLVACGLAGQNIAFASAAFFVLLWVAGMACWRAVLTKRWQYVLAALLTTYTAGGAVLWYLRGEFILNGQLPPSPLAFSPLLAGISLIQEPGNLFCWTAPVALSAAGTIAVVAKFLWKRDIERWDRLNNDNQNRTQ